MKAVVTVKDSTAKEATAVNKEVTVVNKEVTVVSRVATAVLPKFHHLGLQNGTLERTDGASSIVKLENALINILKNVSVKADTVVEIMVVATVVVVVAEAATAKSMVDKIQEDTVNRQRRRIITTETWPSA